MVDITPAGYRILIKQDNLTEKDDVVSNALKAGLIIADDAGMKREQLGVDTGTVVSVGPTAYSQADVPWCVVGDRVAFAKYSGKVFTDPEDKQVYLVVNDDDIIAVIGDDIHV